MNDDLISRKALIADIRSRKYIDKALCEIFETVIEDAPIAFSLSKVIAEIEDLKDVPHDDSVEEMVSTRIWNRAIQKAIGVAKKAAIDFEEAEKVLKESEGAS